MYGCCSERLARSYIGRSFRAKFLVKMFSFHRFAVAWGAVVDTLKERNRARARGVQRVDNEDKESIKQRARDVEVSTESRRVYRSTRTRIHAR